MAIYNNGTSIGGIYHLGSDIQAVYNMSNKVWEKPVSTSLMTGLVAAWEFNEMSGSTLIDQCGSYNGANNGATVNNPGILGTSYYFNGIGNYITVADSGAISTQLTLCAWIKYEDVGSANSYFDPGIIAKYCPTNNMRSFDFSIYDRSYLQFCLSSNGQVSSILTSGNVLSMLAGNWCFVVAIYDGIVMKILLNNSVIATLNVVKSIYVSSQPIWIGCQYLTQSPYMFKGYIDQILMYNRALSAGELTALYNSGNGLAYSNF